MLRPWVTVRDLSGAIDDTLAESTLRFGDRAAALG
jgi:hypothetical protein